MKQVIVFLYLVIVLIGCFLVGRADAGMTAASCKTKVKTAYTARTGQQMTEGAFNALEDICKGIIDEIKANAQVSSSGTVTSGAGSGGSVTATGTVQ